MTTRFNNAINALVQAFFNDELKKGNCNHCAVGSICEYGFNVNGNPLKLKSHDWADTFCTDTKSHKQHFYEREVKSNKMTGISVATGYSAIELAKIEYTFEITSKIHHCNYIDHTKQEIMEDQYNGLIAVVDVLCELEGIESEEYKKLFEYTI